MSAVKNVLGALLYQPESEPMRRKAQQAAQLFKDFQFSTSDGFEVEARKVVNIVQQCVEDESAKMSNKSCLILDGKLDNFLFYGWNNESSMRLI